jgi:hypothetical protein
MNGLGLRRWSGGRARPGGFTVVEISVALVIGVLLMMGLITLWQTGTRMSRKSDGNLEAIQSASFVMAVISDDLRNLTVTRNQMAFVAPGAPEPPPNATPAAAASPPAFSGQNPGATPTPTPTPNAANASNQGINSMGIKSDGTIDPEKAIYKLTKPNTVFKFSITDPDKMAGGERVLRYIEYSLVKALERNPPLYHFVRKDLRDPAPPRIYRESYVTEVQFELLRSAVPPAGGSGPTAAASANPTPAASPGSRDENLYYLRALVVGSSTTRQESGNPVGVDASADYYHLPLMQVFCLDSVGEHLSHRGMGQYWNETPNYVTGP